MYVEVLARDWTVVLDWVSNSAGGQVTKNLSVLNLDTIGFSGSSKDSDTTTFQDAGNKAHLVTSRGRSVKLNGIYKEDMEASVEEPSLAALYALANETGRASLGHFTMTSPAGKTRAFLASVTFDNEFNGSKEEITKWNCTLKVSGAVTHG